MSAPITDAHREIVRRIRERPDNDLWILTVEMSAQLIADSEAKAKESLLVAYDTVCRQRSRLATECNTLRAQVAKYAEALGTIAESHDSPDNDRIAREALRDDIATTDVVSQLRAEVERLREDDANSTKFAAREMQRASGYAAEFQKQRARAEMAEADLAASKADADKWCKLANERYNELAAERARLDWLESPVGRLFQREGDCLICRGSIDAAMKEDTK